VLIGDIGKMHQLIADLADRNQTLEALQGDSQEAGHHPGNLFRWRGLFPVVCVDHTSTILTALKCSYECH